MKDDVDENKHWRELSPKKRVRLEKDTRNLKNAHLAIENRYSFLIYAWLLILNAGGLAGTITLLNINQLTTKFILLCVTMSAVFFLGILSIFIAAKLENIRFRTNRELISNEYDDFVNNRTTDSCFAKNLKKNCYPTFIISFLEGFSFFMFFVGVVFGITYLILSPEDLCGNECKSNTCVQCLKQNEHLIAPNVNNTQSIFIENNSPREDKWKNYSENF